MTTTLLLLAFVGQGSWSQDWSARLESVEARSSVHELAMAKQQEEFKRFKTETSDTIRNLQELVDETKRDFENYRMATQKQIGPIVMGTASEPQQDFQPYGPARVEVSTSQPVQAVYYSMPANVGYSGSGYGGGSYKAKAKSRGYGGGIPILRSVSAPLRSR